MTKSRAKRLRIRDYLICQWVGWASFQARGTFVAWQFQAIKLLSD